MKLPRPKKLAAFQSLMHGWSELAPYNFIHALRLGEPANLDRWRHATGEALCPLEFGTAEIETPKTDIDAHLEAELNRGFVPDALPLRFFVIEAAPREHWFGVVIDHWLADDFSCRALLQRIYCHYRALKEPPAGWARMHARPQWRGWAAEWGSFLRQAGALRRARRIPLGDPLDFTVGCFRTELPPEALAALRDLGKRQGGTVHDVFLAAAAQACAAYYPPSPDSGRDAIGLVSAMDLRRFRPDDAQTGFGFLITLYTVVERNPERVPLPELVARIAQTTRRWKAVSGGAVLTAGHIFWRLACSQRAKATLYQRGAPLAAGLSNVNLSGSWIERSRIAEFRRIGPAGPAVPLVFMITTLRGRLFIDTTYRTTAFSRPDAEKLVADLVGRLQPREPYQPLPGSA